MVACEHGHDAVVQYLLTVKKSNGNQDLATDEEKTETISSTINSTINGTTALTLASQQGHVAVVRTLLQHGALADLSKSSDDNKTNPVMSPLYAASARGQDACVQVLLQQGQAPVDDDHNSIGSLQQPSQQQGKRYYGTPLCIATRAGHASTVAILLGYGANPNIRFRLGQDNMTPLHVATILGLEEIAELLLKHQADPNARNDAGETPLLYATQRNNQALISLLRDDFGARPTLETRIVSTLKMGGWWKKKQKS